MNFNDLLQRANLNSIESFLRYGGDDFTQIYEKPYSERIKEAQENAEEFFKTRYHNIDEFDEISGYFEEQVSVFQDVYFEIGVIVGAKIAFEIKDKIKEID